MLKNRITYALILALLFLFYIYCNSYVTIYAAALMIGLTVMGAVPSFIASRKLLVSIRSGCADTLHRTVEFCAVLTNDTFFSAPIVTFDMCFRDLSENADVCRKVRVSVGNGENKEVYLSIGAPYAAYIGGTIKRVRVYDGFGIFSFPVKCEASVRTLITPAASPSEEHRRSIVLQTEDSDRFSDTEKGDDRSQVFEVREYRDGDDIRNVHWRLSSKLDSLMVKEFSKPLDERCSVLIETSLCGIEDPEEIKQKTDRILSEFTALSVRLLQSGMIFAVYYYSAAAGDLICTDVEKTEDISAVLKGVLSEAPADSAFLSLDSYRAKLSGGAVYYIYDSSAANGAAVDETESFAVIDCCAFSEE